MVITDRENCILMKIGECVIFYSQSNRISLNLFNM